VLRLKLRLHPPRGRVNFQGHDRERMLFASGVGALAIVLDSQVRPRKERKGQIINRIRADIRESIKKALPAGEARALVLSLLIADRSELGGGTWSLLRKTGTGHLLAISGLHIGLAAVVGFWMMQLVLTVLPSGISKARSGFSACCTGAFVLAVSYGALAGFPVSTVRALTMLAIATWAIRSNRAPIAFKAWLAAFIFLLLADPFTPLTAGFWLSFAAVLGLIVFFTPRCGRSSWWTTLPRAQVAVMAVTLPLGAFWFQTGSILALPSNLIAIPWVSFLSVPLVLAAVVAYPLPFLFEALLEAAQWSCSGLLKFLGLVARIGNSYSLLTPAINAGHLVLALGGGLLLLLPRGCTARWLGLCLMGTLFLPRAATLEEGEYSIETLDVGQGLAVLVRTRTHSLLYDTGPGDGKHWSLAESTVAPALASDGNGGPDLIVVSHADLDHAGGMRELRARFVNAELLLNRPQDNSGVNGCHQGQSWEWDGVEFDVLHPSVWLPYQGNDSSCVISIDNGKFRSLLTGDIGNAVESRLSADIDSHDFITVPHHGSASSSSRLFLDAVQPAWAVVSAAYANRFGFPRPEVIRDYDSIETRVFSTVDCGALEIKFPTTGKPGVRAARNEGPWPWRWHANRSDCMVRSDRSMYHLDRLKLKE
jgi:competence protein ComEC